MRRSLDALGVLTVWVLFGCGSGNGNPASASPGGGAGADVGAAGSSTGGAQATGGASSSGGTPSTGGSTASGGGANAGAPGSGGSAGAPEHHVGKCDGLAAKGVWEDVTPPVDLAGGSGFGINAFGVDPNNSGTLYVGTSSLGIWKSTDCAATWVHINTGANSPVCPTAAWTNKTCAALLDTGRQWSVMVDPNDSNTVYASNGYGTGVQGALKSTNGGVDWEDIWPGHASEFSGSAPGAVAEFKMDPTNSKHLAVSFHAACTGASTICFAESQDAGASWSLFYGKPSWGGEKGFVYIPDGKTLFVGTESDGLFRTTDRGATFTQLTQTVAHSPGQLYHSPTGVFYLGTSTGVLRSPDGVTWSLVPNSGQLIGGMIGDGTNLYVGTYAVGFVWGQNLQPYLTSPESDGTHWTTMPSPGMTQGGTFGYDADHHILYTSAAQEGFWRVVVK